MYLFENPVLQRELLVNLRMPRAFVLLFLYVGLLGLVVYAAWPAQQKLDLSKRPEDAARLVGLFFLGQYLLMSLMVPAFAGGAITGEKERRTYEMLLASPLRPGAIVLGKLLASMCHLGVLVFCSLPIVMLCLPLGGMSFWEVLATYVAMVSSVVTFAVICLAAGSYFTRTIAALVVSYLIILPMALVGVAFYLVLGGEEARLFRLVVLGVFCPAGCAAVCAMLTAATSRRLLHPPDLGSEAKEVVDPELEQQRAVGMVIRSDRFPDRLFAPPKRPDLMDDRVNPVYDKEMRSELFGQGTLMLRLVIQLSMFLALPLMALCLYIVPAGAPWYAGYVLVFNMLVGPVFSAGTITSERERQTLELLLTTTVSPWQILWGKFLSGFRVSFILTSFLVWPLLLAWLLPPFTYWGDTSTLLGYALIIALTSLTTTTLATFCSLLTRKTSVAMIAAYTVVLVLFILPVVADAFARLIVPMPAQAGKVLAHYGPAGRLEAPARLRLTGPTGSVEVSLRAGQSLAEAANEIQRQGNPAGLASEAIGDYLFVYSRRGAAVGPQGQSSPRRVLEAEILEGNVALRVPLGVWIRRTTFVSPFAAVFALPLKLSGSADRGPRDPPVRAAQWPIFWGFSAFYLLIDGVLLAAMVWLFNVRWRVGL